MGRALIGRIAVVLGLVAGLVVGAAPAPASASEFSDVPADAYYEDAVAWLLDQGITNGTSSTTFSPGEPIDRAQAATLLWRLGFEYGGVPHDFVDVPPGSYYDTAVGWSLLHKITNGVTATTYEPAMAVTRAQLGTMLWRYAGEPEANGPHPFVDVPAGSGFETAVAWMVETGITTGTSPTTFSPDDVVTRAQAATMLWRYVGEPPVGDPVETTNHPLRAPHQYDCTLQDSIPVIECEALVAINDANDGQLRSSVRRWLVEPDPSDWYGAYQEDSVVTRLFVVESDVGSEILNLEVLPPAVADLKHLRSINFDQNNIPAIPPEIGRLPELERLSMVANPISTLPPEIGTLTNLRVLDMSWTGLQSLPAEVANLANLRSLYVSGGTMGTLPDAVWELDLVVLSARESGLTTIPSDIANFTNLERLDVDGNLLTELPDEIGAMTELRHLSVWGNELTSLPPGVWANPKLEWLDVGFNQISVVPSTVDDLVSLEWLSLDGNRLTTLPQELMNLSNLWRMSAGWQETCITVTDPAFIAWLDTMTWDRCP